MAKRNKPSIVKIYNFTTKETENVHPVLWKPKEPRDYLPMSDNEVLNAIFLALYQVTLQEAGMTPARAFQQVLRNALEGI